jgi:predicted glycoside hydrolase/deacetylase ChbG (UPF0249 family)
MGNGRQKFLIVNADDFGASTGINRGILECHTHGVLTSASLMVDGAAAAEAAALVRDHPSLSIGLHWDVVGEDDRDFDPANLDAAAAELARQLDRFVALTGRAPTHVDSHKHVHRHEVLQPVFEELVRPLGVPLRGCGTVKFVGGFYAQWEYGKTDLDDVGVEHLERLLRAEVGPGWTELGCHPGYVSPGFVSIYSSERQAEIATLTHPRIRGVIDELGIHLSSYADFASRRPRP